MNTNNLNRFCYPHLPDEFQSRALKTWQSVDELPGEQLLHASMGLAGEAGETLDHIKKVLWKPGHEPNKDKLIAELGDCLYYLSIMTHLVGLSLEDLAQMNREKLSGGKHGWDENEDARK